MLDILKQVNKSKAERPYRIHIAIVNRTAGIMGKPLTRLFRAPLDDKRLPGDWLPIKIIPFNKTGDDDHYCSYRLVGLMQIMLKTFESVLCDRMAKGPDSRKPNKSKPKCHECSCLDNLVGFVDEVTIRKGIG